MANKGNDLPPKVYKQMLIENYQQSYNDGNKIKNIHNRNQDPILQNTDRYIPPRTKGNILTEEYYKKMVNKTEKNHMRRIPLKDSLTSGVKVVEIPKKREGIKMNPKVRRNQDSTKSYENYQHLKCFKKTDNLKNFYLDNFNSIKQNQIDLADKRINVSNKK